MYDDNSPTTAHENDGKRDWQCQARSRKPTANERNLSAILTQAFLQLFLRAPVYLDEFHFLFVQQLSSSHRADQNLYIIYWLKNTEECIFKWWNIKYAKCWRKQYSKVSHNGSPNPTVFISVSGQHCQLMLFKEKKRKQQIILFCDPYGIFPDNP